MKNITVLVLAGGDSSRLWPLTDKHFINFFNRPLIYYSISQLVKEGFSDFVFVTREESKKAIGEIMKNWKNIRVEIVKQVDPRGMAGAVISAKDHISQKPVLVIGPTDIHESILYRDLNKLVSGNPDAILAGTTQGFYFPGGYLTVKDGYVRGIIEKPPPGKLPSNIINFVFDYFKNGTVIIDAIEEIKTKKDDLYETAISNLINKGMKFKFLPYKGYWGYLKYPWHVLTLMEYYLNQITERKIRKAEIDKSTVIVGNVFIEGGVRIMENVKILGPTYIGRGTVIGTNSLIRESMIGENSVVGFSSEITRSYIGNNCWFHNNYVGDSVLSDNVSMGAGSITANFKLNETAVKDTGRIRLGCIIGKNVRIGVNCSIMPGVKIGRNSFIGAGVVLDADLADNKFCSLPPKSYRVTDNKFVLDSKVRDEALKALKK